MPETDPLQVRWLRVSNYKIGYRDRPSIHTSARGNRMTQLVKQFRNRANSSRWLNSRGGAGKRGSANTQRFAYKVLEHELRVTWLRNKGYTDTAEGEGNAANSNYFQSSCMSSQPSRGV